MTLTDTTMNENGTQMTQIYTDFFSASLRLCASYFQRRHHAAAQHQQMNENL